LPAQYPFQCRRVGGCILDRVCPPLAGITHR
jgi:hypothetical protein